MSHIIVLMILVGCLISCSEGNGLHSSESINSVQIPHAANTDSSGKDEAPVPTPAETPAPSNSAKESVSPPANVLGSYLHCIRIQNGTLPRNEASVGCTITINGNKQPLAPDSKVNWGYTGTQVLEFVFTELPSNAAYHVIVRIKADNEPTLIAQLPAVRISALVDDQALDPAIVASSEICGEPGNFCYDNTKAKNAGVATTPSGKSIEYVGATASFDIWKEVGGNRILKADGSDNWAKQLNPSGKGFSATDVTSYNNIVGRRCPPNVYIDDSNKFATGYCLYYTAEVPQTLNASGSDGILGMGTWSTAKWYVGNIQVCSAKGMRLPTLFETNTNTITGIFYPTSDGSPTFAQTSGIPPNGGSTWTATASTSGGTFYRIWDGPTGEYHDVSNNSNAVTCVLP